MLCQCKSEVYDLTLLKKKQHEGQSSMTVDWKMDGAKERHVSSCKGLQTMWDTKYTSA